MFERFTDRARRVVVLAQEEARGLNHDYIGTEHILLGLLKEGEGDAAKALVSLGVSHEAVRTQIEEIIGLGRAVPSGHIPHTPRSKKLLDLSLRESLQLGHNYIGTEHILLGLVREGEGVAMQVLVKLGVESAAIRKRVIEILSQYEPEAPPHAPRISDLAARPAKPGRRYPSQPAKAQALREMFSISEAQLRAALDSLDGVAEQWVNPAPEVHQLMRALRSALPD